MSIVEKVNAELKTAMKDKDQVKLRTLRSVKSAFLNAATEKGASKEVSDETAMKALQKMAKQRKDSLEVFEEQNREDLAVKEREELEIIESFLPKQMSREELEEEVQKIIEETGASEPKDMGKVMGMASKKLAGRADNKMVAEVAKDLLNK